MKFINVVFIHGIGGNKVYAHKTMYQNLQDALGPEYLINALPVRYLKAINQNQEENFDIMYSGKDKKWLKILKKLRNAFLNSFGDAVSIYHDKETYRRVMLEIDKALKQAAMNEHPTIVISQSLGCQLFSCYMYDAAKRNYYSEQQKSVNLWISTGCNIRAFTHGLSFRKIHAFFPPNKDFKWLNFWNWGDIMGYPMRTLSPSYHSLITKDIHVGGGLPILSHTKYDESNKVIKNIVKAIKAL